RVGEMGCGVNEGEQVRKRRQPLQGRIPGLPLHRIFEVAALEVRVVLGPTGRHHDFERVGGGGQDLREQRVGIERDGRDQLLQLLIAQMLLLCLYLTLLLLVLGRSRQRDAQSKSQGERRRERTNLVQTIRPNRHDENPLWDAACAEKSCAVLTRTSIAAAYRTLPVGAREMRSRRGRRTRDRNCAKFVTNAIATPRVVRAAPSRTLGHVHL